MWRCWERSRGTPSARPLNKYKQQVLSRGRSTRQVRGHGVPSSALASSHTQQQLSVAYEHTASAAQLLRPLTRNSSSALACSDPQHLSKERDILAASSLARRCCGCCGSVSALPSSLFREPTCLAYLPLPHSQTAHVFFCSQRQQRFS